MKSLITRSITHCVALPLASMLAAACAPAAYDEPEPTAEASQDLVINPIPPPPHPAPNKAFIWQGFSHGWEYNHRINRLGDWIDNAGCSGTTCTATVAHSSASGTGNDTAASTTFFDFVGGANVGFLAGESTFDVDTVEAVYITQTNHVTLDLSLTPNLVGRERYFAYLDGFDAVVTPLDNGHTRAKKIQILSLDVSNETKTATGVSFDVSLGFMFDCDSPECYLDSDEVRYRVVAHYGLVGGDATDLDFAVQSSSATYAWDESTEAVPQVVGATRVGASGMAGATLAVRGFSFDVHEHLDGTENHGLHMIAMEDRVDPRSYDPTTGTMTYRDAMFFKQWADGMADTYPPLSWGALRENGKATLRTTVALLQLAQGCMKWPTGQLQQGHSLYWPGGDASADTGAAIDQKTSTIDFSDLGCP
jgi:hypothetical protein